MQPVAGEGNHVLEVNSGPSFPIRAVIPYCNGSTLAEACVDRVIDVDISDRVSDQCVASLVVIAVVSANQDRMFKRPGGDFAG